MFFLFAVHFYPIEAELNIISVPEQEEQSGLANKLVIQK